MVSHKWLIYGRIYPKCYYTELPHCHQIKSHNNSAVICGFQGICHTLGKSDCRACRGQVPKQDEEAPGEAAQALQPACSLRRQPLPGSRSSGDKCIPEPTVGACSRGRNVCYGKDAENNHARIWRSHSIQQGTNKITVFQNTSELKACNKPQIFSCKSK